MENVLFHWIFVGIWIIMAGSVVICDSGSGSKKCNMTLRLNPSSFLSFGYQTLEISNHANSRSDYSMNDCSLLSVTILGRASGDLTLRRNVWSRMLTKKDNSKLQVIVENRSFQRLPVDGIVVLVELDCKGRRCVLFSTDNVKKMQRRKLLSLENNHEISNSVLQATAPVIIAIAGFIILIVVLAMCTCGNITHEKALSNEVGGTEVNHHVVGISSVKIEEEHNEMSRRKESEGSANERRSTIESKKSEVSAQSSSKSVTENGQVNSTVRSASQSSHQGKISVEEEPSPFSSSSRNSVDKIEEVALVSSAPETMSDNTGQQEKERKRTGSGKEVSGKDVSGKEVSGKEVSGKEVSGKEVSGKEVSGKEVSGNDSKESNKSDDTLTRTDSSGGAKKSVLRKISRNRTGSDKNQKSSPEEHEEHKTRFWQRRKSSKTNANVEDSENPSHKKEKKKSKKNGGKKKPEPTSPSSTRPSNLPLPPTPPSSFMDDEAQYEVVVTRTQKPRTKEAVDADYESITTSKTKTYDKVNVLPKDEVRPGSELYECINNEDAKMKRGSSGSHNYDVVETKSPPMQKEPVSLEYAYAVVASRDKPLTPTETSSGSGLYEVVTDDIKQKSGVLDGRKSDVAVEDEYATVQKHSSKRSSKNHADDEGYSQKERSRSGELFPAPAPPPVSSLIHIATSSSVRRRTQSEGDDLNAEHSESSHSTSPSSERPQTMFEVDCTYAKVNMAMKKRHSVEATNPSSEFVPANEGCNEDSDTPPPIPPSLYADLESVRKEEDKGKQAMKKRHSVEATNHSSEFVPANEGCNEDSDTPPPIPPSLYADLESVRKEEDKEIRDQLPSSSSEPKKDADAENAYEEVAKIEIKSITSRAIVSDLKISQAKEKTENKHPLKSPEDPHGVLGRLKPPLGSPRSSDADMDV